MSRAQTLLALIKSLTGFTHGKAFPDVRGIEQIDYELPRFYLGPLLQTREGTATDKMNTHELIIEHSSRDDLETMSDTFLKELDSEHPSGYEFDTAGNPHYLEIRHIYDPKYDDHLNRFLMKFEIDATWSIT